jgi:riboflavin kinase/FMN adenylyltransferase
VQIITNISKAPGVPLAVTVGFFDGVHRGHRFLIDNLKGLATEKKLHTAVITFREHPRKTLHSDFIPELLTTPDEKIALLQETGVDYCFVFDFSDEIRNLTAETFIKDLLYNKLNARYLLIGHDNRIGKDRTDGFDQYVSYGKAVGLDVVAAEEFLYKGKQVSSSEIRRLMDEGDLVVANQLLGSYYTIEGEVVMGQQIGRTIGFPTANMQVVSVEKKIPPKGVYAVRVHIDNQTHNGMLNIGLRPTLTIDNQHPTIEVNIIDFDKIIYGKTIKIQLIKKIRDERRFPDLQALASQIEKDKKEIMSVLQKYTE